MKATGNRTRRTERTASASRRGSPRDAERDYDRESAAAASDAVRRIGQVWRYCSTRREWTPDEAFADALTKYVAHLRAEGWAIDGLRIGRVPMRRSA